MLGVEVLPEGNTGDSEQCHRGTDAYPLRTLCTVTSALFRLLRRFGGGPGLLCSLPRLALLARG